MPLLDHFDWLAPLYDMVATTPEELPIRHHLKWDGGGLLLDAGGGTGRIASGLAPDYAAVIVLDESLPMLRQAVGKDCCQMVAGQTEHLPFPQYAFDRVIIVDAYHHLADQHHSLAELWRTVDRGGRLIVEEPDIKHWGVRLVALIEKLLLMRSHFVPADQIAEALQQLGAEVTIHQQNYTAWVVADKAA